MKMRKVKNLIFILLLSVLCCNVENVFAANATVGVSGNPSGGHYPISIYYNGEELTGYCAKKGDHLQGYWALKEKGIKNYSCEVDNSTNGAKVAYILNSSYDDNTKEDAIRYVISGQTTSNSAALQLINEVNGVSGLMLTKTSENENVVTYTINAAVVPQNIRFECGKNCESVSYDGDKTVKVTVKAPSCSYEFKIIGAGAGASGGALRCSPVASRDQITYAATGSSGNSGTTTPTTGGSESAQTITGSLSNKSSGYYKKYCDNGDNKCQGVTKISTPEYCDMPRENIEITAPENVINDIIGCDDDAGNTYQSTQDGIVDNPYCSVWCKEDYKMELPGPQFTTSGRYFTLDPTIVKVTRTCYAGNGNNNETKAKKADGTTNYGIDIVKFIEDVTKKQKELVGYYNTYKRLEKEIDLINKTTTPTSTTKSKTSDCNDENTYNYYEVAASTYKGYNLNCNEQTGKCEATLADKGTNSHSWGQKVTVKETTDSNGAKTCSNEFSQGEYATKGELINHLNGLKNQAKENMDAARNQLKEMNEHMEKCYSWANDLCYGPNVEFDYNEQYNTDINYERTDSDTNPTENSKDEATYSKTVGDDYNADGNGNLVDVNYLFCDTGGCNNTNPETKAEKISTLVEELYYRKIEIKEAEAKYDNKQTFQSKYPHGTLDKAPEGSEKLPPNYEYLGAVFPVALKTPIGVYKWRLDFDKVGQYNDKTGQCTFEKLGRLNEVAAKVAVNGVDHIGSEIGYVCVYVVDCPGCEYECTCPENLPDGYNCEKYLGEDGYVCKITTPDCPECEVRCINCVFDGDDTFYYRTVSLNYETDDLNPNNRKLGPNWDSENNEKAKDTLYGKDGITTLGEEAYKTAEYTFTITPSHMKAIRDYNRDTGTYVAEDLTYGEVEGVSNIAGYSKFLRGDSTQYSDKTFNTKFFKSATLNTKWHLWTSGIQEAVVSVDNNIGPAWK